MSTVFRCRLAKLGRARFLSHLDLLRALGRAFRRAGIDLVYSSGYHPHPQLSFGPALAVGVESRAEYFEVAVAGEDHPAADLPAALNPVLPEGICLLRVAVPRSVTGALSRIDTASYLIRLESPPDNPEAFALLPGRPNLPVVRQGRDLDLRPLLLELDLTELTRGNLGVLGVTGSSGNLRPEELLTLVPGVKVRRIMRTGLYTRDNGYLREPIFGETINWQESLSFLE